MSDAWQARAKSLALHLVEAEAEIERLRAGTEGIRVVLHVCPICRRQVEWSGNDYGYLCTGPHDARHDDAYAEPIAGFFAPETPAVATAMTKDQSGEPS